MTGTEMGEYLVGAYLKVVKHCDYVDYNVRPPGGRVEGLWELDVIGFDVKSSTAYVCEVVTHIRGLKYGNQTRTVGRLRKKYKRQKHYARRYLKQFKHRNFMIWSPVVSSGLTRRLTRIEGLQVIANTDYSDQIERLCQEARSTYDVGNPAFRLLQILKHMRTKNRNRKAALF